MISTRSLVSAVIFSVSVSPEFYWEDGFTSCFRILYNTWFDSECLFIRQSTELFGLNHFFM